MDLKQRQGRNFKVKVTANLNRITGIGYVKLTDIDISHHDLDNHRARMAAIIAQLTRNNREKTRKPSYETNKCMYSIPPWDNHFNPDIHNKYFVR